MSNVLGKATIKVDAKRIKTKKGSTLDPGGDIGEAVVGATEVHGRSSSVAAPELRAKITQDRAAGVTVDFIRKITNASIVWEGDDGQNYLLREAFTVGRVVLSENQGEIDATFSAIECIPL